MILAIDIGNTNIVVGCIDKEKIYLTERISTIRTKTELEYAIDIKTILDIHHINRADIEGAIISSVVPQITFAARLAVQKILKKDAMIVGPGVKTGLNILLDNPGEMGADRVADAGLGEVHSLRRLGKAAAGDDSKETMDIRHIHKYHFSFLLILPSRKSLYKYLLEKSTNKFMLFFYVDV